MPLNRRRILLSLLAIAALALIPAVFLTGAGYAAEQQVWDAAHSTYTYVARPFADAAIVATLAVSVALVAAAFSWGLRAIAASPRGARRR
ncbi:hypothetical protein [Microbacterium sp. P05]|uniref:hypothetical protein n=1 Tax=Microbacterium sp. P05 TaxID=3366948 RepID=UPI003745E5D1